MRRSVYAVLAAIWRLLRSGLRWRVLRLTHATFLVAVAGVVFDDEGRILLQRHRFWADGSWGLPGGYVEPRESLEEALAREVREESRLAIGDVRLLRAVSGFRFRLEFFFTARLAGGVARPDPGEVLEIRFFAPDGLPEGLLPEHARIVGEAVAARDQRPPSSGSSRVS
ncbi:MAG TPA: NUDIX domain-containing protein [Candidatus Dormibacteraeota bacterium]|jgi:ADP-ribose pyrophosphatase YjhB (NUDIX family)|nr:NUDIX domain-containing protein [Candidatus Dormibacteraeota bacterium]